MRTSKIGAGVLASGLILVVSAPVPAFAATEAPSCIQRTIGSTGGVPSSVKVTLTNRCASNKKLKVIWNNAHDSDCFTLVIGKSTSRSSSIAKPFSSYDKTVLC